MVLWKCSNVGTPIDGQKRNSASIFGPISLLKGNKYILSAENTEIDADSYKIVNGAKLVWQWYHMFFQKIYIYRLNIWYKIIEILHFWKRYFGEFSFLPICRGSLKLSWWFAPLRCSAVNFLWIPPTLIKESDSIERVPVRSDWPMDERTVYSRDLIWYLL